MDITYNLVSFIDVLGVVQGLLFGLLLIQLHSKSRRPTLFLGLFILLFALEPIPLILRDLGILRQRPEWLLLPVSFHFLAYPLFFIYIQKTSIFGVNRPSYWTLIPGAVELITMSVIFFLPTATKIEIKGSSYELVYFLMGLGYTIYISILILKLIHAHFTELISQYSSITEKRLSWSRSFIYASIGFHLLLLLNFFVENSQLYIMISLINVVLIYWVSVKGITQENVTSLYWVPPSIELVSTTLDENKLVNQKPKKINITVGNPNHTELMSEEDAFEIIETVEDYIKNSECFIRHDLTIIDIAEAVNIHPKRISHAINKQLKTNFNSYINAFRVVRAKTLLKSGLAKNLSIEGIGAEAGFHSKTTFYSSFRKVEGMTPAQYKSS